MSSSVEQLLERRGVDRGRFEQKMKRVRREEALFQFKQMRLDAGLSQGALGERLGLSQGRIAQIERGPIGSARVGALQKYVEGLGGRLSLSVELPGGQVVEIPASVATG